MEDRHGPQETIRRNFRDAKILLVEDNPDHGALIQTVLHECMPEVELILAATVDEAWNQLNKSRQSQEGLPRLILLDLYVPRREDGWQLLQLIKESTSPYRLIPVTILSHSGDREDVETSYELGGTSYIIKPSDYPRWLAYFQTLRQYWWNTVTLPPTHF